MTISRHLRSSTPYDSGENKEVSMRVRHQLNKRNEGKQETEGYENFA